MEQLESEIEPRPLNAQEEILKNILKPDYVHDLTRYSYVIHVVYPAHNQVSGYF